MSSTDFNKILTERIIYITTQKCNTSRILFQVRRKRLTGYVIRVLHDMIGMAWESLKQKFRV